MKKLWICNFPKNYDSSIDILLGPWCLLGVENSKIESNNIKFEPDPFSTFKEMRIAYELTSKYTSNYLDTFVSQNDFQINGSLTWVSPKSTNLEMSPTVRNISLDPGAKEEIIFNLLSITIFIF